MTKKILWAIFLNGLALYAVTWLFDEYIIYTGGFWFFVLGGFIIGFLNFFVKPLMKLLSLPLILLSAGLFLIVINIIIFVLTMHIINAINIAGVSVVINEPLTYVLASFILSVINWILHFLLGKK